MDAKSPWRMGSICGGTIQSSTISCKVWTQKSSDLPGHTADGGGTVPADICVTVHKPDLVIIDEKNGSLHIIELTNLDTRHKEKSDSDVLMRQI